MTSQGIVAAGHPLTAKAGADVLRAGGNAVDATIAAMLTSWVAEPLLTGPASGGYMLVAGADEEPVLLDFFVAAPGQGADVAAHSPLVPIEVDFSGDARQIFHVGASSCGTYGTPAGIDEAMRRWGSLPLADLAAPAAAHARAGVVVNAEQSAVVTLLEWIIRSTPAAASLFAGGGPLVREGEIQRLPELGDTIERLAAEGSAPFYEGDIAAAVVECVGAAGGVLTTEDLRGYEVIAREPLSVRYRGRDVLTNPPPSAGGILLALSLRLRSRRQRRLPSRSSSGRSRRRRPPARRSSWTASASPGSPGCGAREWASRRISRSSTRIGARARRHARTDRVPGSSCPARAST